MQITRTVQVGVAYSLSVYIKSRQAYAIRESIRIRQAGVRQSGRQELGKCYTFRVRCDSRILGCGVGTRGLPDSWHLTQGPGRNTSFATGGRCSRSSIALVARNLEGEKHLGRGLVQDCFAAQESQHTQKALAFFRVPRTGNFSSNVSDTPCMTRTWPWDVLFNHDPPLSTSRDFRRAIWRHEQ